MSKRAFELKESAKDSFVDAAVAIPPDGASLSVGDRLKQGKGVIVTEDEHEIAALQTVEVLKETSVPQKAAKSGGKE